MILEGDVLQTLKQLDAGIVQTCVTSPPYFGLRDYGMAEQIGLEDTPEDYVEKLVQVFREVKRVLKDDGTIWVNLGDSYVSGATGHKTVESILNSSTIGMKMRPEVLQGNKFDKTKIPGLKTKDLIGIPWMVAFALRADGWYLRQDIIWAKPNPMPESVKDRCTKSHEYIFLLSKQQNYYYDSDAILEPANYDGRKDTVYKGSVKYENSGQTNARIGGERWANKIYDKGMSGDGTNIKGHSGNFKADGTPMFQEKDGIPARNKRDVWTVNTKPYKGAHFAAFNPALIEPCILAGSKEGDIVLDVFNGSGTTGEVALKHKRKYIGCELNPEYIKLTEERLSKVQVQMM